MHTLKANQTPSSSKQNKKVKNSLDIFFLVDSVADSLRFDASRAVSCWWKDVFIVTNRNKWIAKIILQSNQKQKPWKEHWQLICMMKSTNTKMQGYLSLCTCGSQTQQNLILYLGLAKILLKCSIGSMEHN